MARGSNGRQNEGTPRDNGGTDQSGPGGFSVDHNSTINECGSHGGTWFSFPVDPSKVSTDPNSNWVALQTGSGVGLASCNGTTGSCDLSDLSGFANGLYWLLNSVSFVPDTGGLPYMSRQGPPPPPKLDVYANPFEITYSRPPTVWGRVATMPGCVNNSAIEPAGSAHPAASTDAPPGHASGQRSARTGSTVLNSPANGEVVDGLVGGISMIDPTVKCLAGTN